MKRLLLSLFVLGAASASAQNETMHVHLKSGEVVDYNVNNIESITFEDLTDEYFVDLGLPSGTLWAKCNVGAKTPEEFGDYFAWGETEPKETYSYDNYKFLDKVTVENIRGQEEKKPFYTKYTFFEQYYYYPYEQLNVIEPDRIRFLEPEDDAATVNCGSLFVTPTFDQIKELAQYTTCISLEQNGVEGQVLQGNNGNTIFIPKAGYHEEYYGVDYLIQDYYGVFWTSELFGNSDGGAVGYHPGYPKDGWAFDRTNGLPVRPVMKKQ